MYITIFINDFLFYNILNSALTKSLFKIYIIGSLESTTALHKYELRVTSAVPFSLLPVTEGLS